MAHLPTQSCLRPAREALAPRGCWLMPRCCSLPPARRTKTWSTSGACGPTTQRRAPQFAKCQNSMGNTQVLCLLILFAEDVDPDKVLRRYRVLDLEVKVFVKGAQGAVKCSLSFACEGVFTPIFHDANCFMRANCLSSAIQVSITQGAYWWSEWRCNTCCTSERSICEHGA